MQGFMTKKAIEDVSLQNVPAAGGKMHRQARKV
jgi:hypothetical protein